MKNLQYPFVFLLCASFFSCKQEVKIEEKLRNKASTLETRKEFLSNLMDIGYYHVKEEKIKEDLATILDSINDSDEIRAVAGNAQHTIEKIYECPLLEDEISLFSENKVSAFEGEKTRLFVYKLQNSEKEGFAIASNDLRIGEVLAIIEEGEFKKDITDDPFLRLITTNMSAHIKRTMDEWAELKIEKQRSI